MIHDKANTVTDTREEIKEKARKIVALLPGENCGKCGSPNCGGFALSVARGEASPHGCHKVPGPASKICEALGIELPENKELDTDHRGHHGHAGMQHGCKHGEHGHHHGHGEHHHHSKD